MEEIKEETEEQLGLIFQRADDLNTYIKKVEKVDQEFRKAYTEDMEV